MAGTSPGSGSTPGLGPCRTCGCGCDPTCDSCSFQVALFLLPPVLLSWLNTVSDFYLAGDCAHAPAAPTTTTADYDETIELAYSILSAFDWNTPPIQDGSPVPFSVNEFREGGPLLCPAMQSLRYALRDKPGGAGGDHGYEYAWNNNDTKLDSTIWPLAFAHDHFFNPGQTLPYFVGPASGLFWDQANFNNPCFASTIYESGFPLLVATWTRHCGFSQACESIRVYEYDPVYDPGAADGWFIARTGACGVDSGTGPGGLRPSIVTPSEACGIIHAAGDGFLYAGGGSGVFPGYDFPVFPYGSRPYPPDILTPGGGQMFIDWLYQVCPSCAECP